MGENEFLFNFNNFDYFVYFDNDKRSLNITIEKAEETEYFQGTFNKEFIEEGTAIAGSFKNFKIFIKMLKSALKKESSNVYIDFIEGRALYPDLDKLIKKLYGDQEELIENSSYLVITYVSDFENTYYPLQLFPQEDPEAFIFHRTINRYRSNQRKLMENFLKKTHVKTICPCCKENEKLRNEILSYKDQIRGFNDIIKKLKNPYQQGSFTKDFFLGKSAIENEYQNNINNYIEKENEIMKVKKDFEGIIGNERTRFNYFLDEKNKEIKSLKGEIIDLKKTIINSNHANDMNKSHICESRLKKSQSNTTLFSNYQKNISTCNLMKKSSVNSSQFNKSSTKNNSLLLTKDNSKKVSSSNSKINSTNKFFLDLKHSQSTSTQQIRKSDGVVKKIVSDEEIENKLKKIEKLLLKND
jgi:hypothetical protein